MIRLFPSHKVKRLTKVNFEALGWAISKVLESNIGEELNYNITIHKSRAKDASFMYLEADRDHSEYTMHLSCDSCKMRYIVGSILHEIRHILQEQVEKYGPEAFIVEELIEGELDNIRKWEKNINTTNLWPKGYNGNAGLVIVRSDLTEAKRHAGYQKYLNNRSQEHVDAANKKRKITRAGRSKEEIDATADKLSKAAKKHWESLDDKAKAEFLKRRAKAKSEAYQKQSEEYKQAIRDKIKKSMCKKQYKSPAGIHASTVDGGRAEGISPSLFNHRCKSEYYPDYSILSS